MSHEKQIQLLILYHHLIFFMKDKFRNLILRGSERSVKAKKNILYMLLIKGGNILIGLLLVPLTLEYVDSEKYGIWMALSSMVAWISFFDIGISNGLKNRLAEALACQDYDLCKKYVSTTYAILCLIFIPLMMLLLIAAPFVNWSSILNISTENSEGLLASICIIITYFCISFILNTINTVILAEQRPADASLRTFIQQLVSLGIIYVLTLTTKGSLVNLCLALCASPLIVVLIFNITLFRGRYKAFSPSIQSIDFKVAPNLMKLGVQFFIIQIAAIIQYQMINFLILRYYGASEVTSYNIAYKYFSILTMIWGILTTPLWVAVTDAISKKDYAWIQNVQKKYLAAFTGFAVLGIIMLLASPHIYHFWIGNKVEISFILSTWVLIYNIVLMFGSIFVMIINGTGELKIQTYASLVSPIVFIGCSMLLIKYGLGIESILIASIISNFNGLVLAPIQCHQILKNNE